MNPRDIARSNLTPRQLQNVAHRRVAARAVVGSQRILPELVILGGMRCGTSSLYKYLGEHRHFAPSLRKETEYFSDLHDRGPTWYRGHFPLRATAAVRRRRGLHTVGFEATPYYLWHPHAPARLAAELPEAKLVVLLRDPAERAVSHYVHMARLGFEKRSFEQAVAEETTSLAEDRDRIFSDPGFASKWHHRFSYVERGQYAEQLQRWFAVLPRENFLVLEAGELYADAQGVVDGIADLVRVPRDVVDTTTNHSRNMVGPKRRIEVPSTAAVAGRFTESDAALSELLGWTPTWL